MFLEFYGLKEQPFGVTPDPRFASPSRTHSKAFNTLARGLEAGCGFLTLIAPPGMGKTTLVFQLLKEVNQTSNAIYLFHTQCNSRELLRYLLGGLGVETAGLDFVSMHEKLNQLLSREVLDGRRLVLIIDESHNLDDSVLETVRLLSDYETHEMKLMQIVLVGQPPLAEKLSSPSLVQLKQRITVVCRLEPLTRAESFGYIEHRLRVAGYRGAPLFTPVALDMIVASAGGVPRNINKLCFNALLAGYTAGYERIDSTILNEVLADLAMESLLPMGGFTEHNLALIPPSPAFATQFAASRVPTDRIYADTGRGVPGEPMRSVDEVRPLLAAQPEVSRRQATSPPRRALAARAGVGPAAFQPLEPGAGQPPPAVSNSEVGPGGLRRPATEPPSPSPESSFRPGGRRDELPRQSPILSHGKVSDVPAAGKPSSSSKMPPPRLIPRANHSGTLFSHSTSSKARTKSRTLGFLALVSVILLVSLLLFAYWVGALRQWPDQVRTAASSITTYLRGLRTSSEPVNPFRSAGDAPLRSEASARPFFGGSLGPKVLRIVVDPGHGGRDPGAAGPSGLLEKDLCLDIARRLGVIIEQRLPSMEVIFTRTDDTFVSLKARPTIANEMKADLFLSVHANISSDQVVRRVETYYLDFAASSEVKEIAARENNMAQEEVADWLTLMKKNASAEKTKESRMLAENIHDSLSRFAQGPASSVQNPYVAPAPLVVLAGANMPSVLAEISYLSNPSDEHLLKSGEYREHLAEALFQGIAAYLQSRGSFAESVVTHPDVGSPLALPVETEQARNQR